MTHTKSISTLVTLILFFVFLCACSSVPSRTITAQPFVDPSKWSKTRVIAISAATPLLTWWAYFNDTLLNQHMSTPLQANSSKLGAQASLRRSHAQSDVAAAGLWSSLGSSEALFEAIAVTLGGTQVTVAADLALAYIVVRNAQARLGITRGYRNY